MGLFIGNYKARRDDGVRITTDTAEVKHSRVRTIDKAAATLEPWVTRLNEVSDITIPVFCFG